MKKSLYIVMLLCMIVSCAAGCTKVASLPASGDSIAGNTVKIDVDLTALTSTLVYGEVYNMLANPDDYMGKTVKMSGLYYSSYYEETGLNYHFVVIEDATACCAQGLEFIWNGKHKYPDDYPKEQTEIAVVGIFGSYEEMGITYYYLAVDDINT